MKKRNFIAAWRFFRARSSSGKAISRHKMRKHHREGCLYLIWAALWPFLERCLPTHFVVFVVFGESIPKCIWRTHTANSDGIFDNILWKVQTFYTSEKTVDLLSDHLHGLRTSFWSLANRRFCTKITFPENPFFRAKSWYTRADLYRQPSKWVSRQMQTLFRIHPDLISPKTGFFGVVYYCLPVVFALSSCCLRGGWFFFWS